MSHANRGRPLERLILQVAKVYERQGRAWLRKTPTPTRWDGGRIVYAAKAGLDFTGSERGRTLHLEAKTISSGASLPLTDWPAHQRSEMERLARLGDKALLVVWFSHLRETYSLAWSPELGDFLHAPWRNSISVDMLRAWGLLVPQLLPQGCLFLDGVAHPGRAGAIERMAEDRRACEARDAVREQVQRTKQQQELAQLEQQEQAERAKRAQETPEEREARYQRTVDGHKARIGQAMEKFAKRNRAKGW